VFLEAGRIGAQAKIVFCTNRHDSKLVYDDEKWLSVMSLHSPESVISPGPEQVHSH